VKTEMSHFAQGWDQNQNGLEEENWGEIGLVFDDLGCD
jgi:hypothetical protein